MALLGVPGFQIGSANRVGPGLGVATCINKYRTTFKFKIMSLRGKKVLQNGSISPN